MVTPVEIQSKVFKSGGLGYDKKDVDSFMKDILQSYEDIYRENVELHEKINVLTEGVQYYKTIEKTLQKALVLAEKTAEDTRKGAEKEAKRIEMEATVKANALLADARAELEKLHQQTIVLTQQYEKYKVQFKNLAAAQIELLETDAFRINIQNLDTFVAADERSTIEKREEVSEIGAHLSDIVTDDEYDFSGYELDGQEEFDFLDLKDNEDI